MVLPGGRRMDCAVPGFNPEPHMCKSLRGSSTEQLQPDLSFFFSWCFLPALGLEIAAKGFYTKNNKTIINAINDNGFNLVKPLK